MGLGIKTALKKLRYKGTRHFCPVCKSRLGGFLPFGIKARANARCPICGSLERHRLVWLFFENETDLFSGEKKSLLHIAPEGCFYDEFKKIKNLFYITSDLKMDGVLKNDIESICFKDKSFDVIYCSHVLEHVIDDMAAMKGMARVLKDNGWALVQVPVEGEKTKEDPTVIDPKDRERIYGHPDHYRSYGYDYVQRLKSSGFIVSAVKYGEKFDENLRKRYGIGEECEDIYLCRRAKL